MKKYLLGLLAATLSLFGISAHAALDAGIATGFTAVATDFAALLALAYPLLITITTGLVIFGMVKMFIHKAAGK